MDPLGLLDPPRVLEAFVNRFPSGRCEGELRAERRGLGCREEVKLHICVRVPKIAATFLPGGNASNGLSQRVRG